MAHYTLPSVDKHGQMYKFNFISEKFEIIPLINYHYDHFHPHGLSLLKNNNNKEQQLFVINHRTDDDNNDKIIEYVDIFDVQIDENTNKIQLKLVQSITDPLFT
ncbi:unnamed protein product, partial [Didymodactylos carnosus]